MMLVPVRSTFTRVYLFRTLRLLHARSLSTTGMPVSCAALHIILEAGEHYRHVFGGEGSEDMQRARVYTPALCKTRYAWSILRSNRNIPSGDFRQKQTDIRYE
jgi:hypothetical protein